MASSFLLVLECLLRRVAAFAKRMLQIFDSNEGKYIFGIAGQQAPYLGNVLAHFTVGNAVFFRLVALSFRITILIPVLLQNQILKGDVVVGPYSAITIVAKTCGKKILQREFGRQMVVIHIVLSLH